MISWAFIFEAPETDPAVDRMVIERGGVRSTVVAVPEPSMAPQVAADLVAGGVQFIELCGGFEPEWAGKVIEATAGRVPVGTVGYAGGASVARLADIFAPTA
ncbi:DUF6506 family protein [Luteimonas sp. R10]|uniref:DUF6506 family protein n=1 Tax=Luteimonas sp. R10 TaxID=3108176 RepID=UPI003091DD09|nr:DUF6506 family protein [Luteimonas sp. R10]